MKARVSLLAESLVKDDHYGDQVRGYIVTRIRFSS